MQPSWLISATSELPIKLSLIISTTTKKQQQQVGKLWFGTRHVGAQTVYRESRMEGLKLGCLISTAIEPHGMDTRGVQEEGITSSLPRQLAYEQLAAHSEPARGGLSWCKVLLKGFLLHRCVAFSTRRTVAQLRSTDHPPCVSESAKLCAYGSRSERRQTCSRSCFPKGWRWWEEGKNENSVSEAGKRVSTLRRERSVAFLHQLGDKDK